MGDKSPVNHRTIAAMTTFLVILTVTASFLAIRLVGNSQQPEFFVGVEYAYSYPNGTAPNIMLEDVRALVDRVKGFTNLFVFGNPQITFDEDILNTACDYVRDAGLYFIVLLTGRNSYPTPTQPFHWIAQATQRYGDKLLGVYRFDEPGGNQLDLGEAALFSAQNRSLFPTYASLAGNWTYYLQIILNAYANSTYEGKTTHSRTVTSDYGLYWFDYATGYDVVWTEFGSNHSRQTNVALCRGAASSHGKDWGAIMTWTYDNAPYIEPAGELYNDLAKAYCCGAKYAVVFNYPNNITGQPYGILSDAHLAAMERFWQDIHALGNPELVKERVDVAYVLPQDYGFGFRKADDAIWGLWPADDLSAKVFGDVVALALRYDCRFDVVYDYAEFREGFQSRYGTLLFWNETLP